MKQQQLGLGDDVEKDYSWLLISRVYRISKHRRFVAHARNMYSLVFDTELGP